ncbi:hypothetical protein [Roseibacillus persicicus]|uniref:Uncharacterized protein n=1 Tax=Roseibacillus persicicus TaxID=454148 RepID=A0A918TNB1_9BACT|nr:hypothetical protein [Roseibacillus persicicus]MDQ8189362.1 hypothetical protein [Roseibacillus persicicus]GHC55741.1 hypothetical protein GCM10007100_23150 [Roseibacillus persicicus]
MSTTRKQHLNVASATPKVGDEYNRQLEQAESQLQKLQQQREEIERKRLEAEEITHQRQDFIDGQIELLERLDHSVQAVDREIFEARQGLKELEDARKTFASHLQTLQGIDPRKWKKTKMPEEVQNAMDILEACENDYEEVVATISEGRRRGFLSTPKSAAQDSFVSTVRQGLAFNLPIIVLGSIALLVYLSR